MSGIDVFHVNLFKLRRIFGPLVGPLKETAERTMCSNREAFFLVCCRVLVKFVKLLAADAFVTPMTFRFALAIFSFSLTGRAKNSAREAMNLDCKSAGTE